MFKSFFLTVLSSIASTTFITETGLTVTVPLSQKVQSLKIINFELSTPICYMKTSNGKVLDLSKLCEQPKTSKTSSKTSFSLYNDLLIKKFDEELYGR